MVTFPKAYHSSLHCGFTCSEGVNFAPPDWLQHGTDVLHAYRLQARPPLISHDALLLLLVQAAALVRTAWRPGSRA